MKNKIILYPAEVREKIKKWGEEGVSSRAIAARVKKEYPQVDPPSPLTVQKFLRKYFISSATTTILNLVNNRERQKIVAQVKQATGEFGKQLKKHYNLIEKTRKRAELLLDSNARETPRMLDTYARMFDSYIKILDRIGFFEALLKEKQHPAEKGVEFGQYDVEKQLATLIKIFERKGVKPKRIK